MPNGSDKNWIRLLAALDGFRAEFGHWPTRVRLHPLSLEDLRDHILGPEAFAAVNEKVALISDESGFLAEDEEGRVYDYGRSGFPSERPDPDAAAWLAVRPGR